LPAQRIEVLNLTLERSDFVVDVFDARASRPLRLTVGTIQFLHVPRNVLFDLLDARFELALRVVLIAVVHRLELATIDRHLYALEHIQPVAKDDELAADVANRLPVLLAEVGNCLEVRRESVDQPHQLYVALSFTFETPAGLDAVQVTVDIDLQ